MSIEFKHQQHAHCESGVSSNLLAHEGINVTEPMAFGVGAGLFFGHLPFVKVNGTPGTTYRIWPGAIFKRVFRPPEPPASPVVPAGAVNVETPR